MCRSCNRRDPQSGASLVQYALLCVLLVLGGVVAKWLWGAPSQIEVTESPLEQGDAPSRPPPSNVVGACVLILEWRSPAGFDTVLARGVESECASAVRLIEQAQQLAPSFPSERRPRVVALLGDGKFFSGEPHSVDREMGRFAAELVRHAGGKDAASVAKFLRGYENLFPSLRRARQRPQ